MGMPTTAAPWTNVAHSLDTPRGGAIVTLVLIGTLLGLAPPHAQAQWRATEVPGSFTSTTPPSITYGTGGNGQDPLWMRRVRAFRRVGGVLFGMGGAVLIAGEVAFSQGGSINMVFATEMAGMSVAAAGLFTLTGAEVRRRRVQIHLGLRDPMPEQRGRRRRITGGVLLGMVGGVVGGTLIGISIGPECNGCEGSAALVIAPAVLGSLFTVGGVALLTAGRANRFPAHRRVRISLGVSHGVPTFTAQF